MLVDSHCHLDFPDFAGDIDAVVGRARAAGITAMLTIGTRMSHFGGVLDVARRFDDVFCTVGVHPHWVASETAIDLDTLLGFASDPKVVGFGETGLDYYYDAAPRERQMESFRIHVEAARRTNLPVVIHTRDADADTAQFLQDEMGKGAFTGLLHCFSSGGELAEKAIELGFYISVSGIATFKAADALRAVLAKVPLDRLLIETDCPYLAPVPMRGKRNEPAYVAHTAQALAAIKGVGIADVEAATTANFLRLFTKAVR